MERHDREPTARPKRALGGVKRGDEFAKLVAEETEKWSKVVRFAGLKAE